MTPAELIKAAKEIKKICRVSVCAHCPVVTAAFGPSAHVCPFKLREYPESWDLPEYTDEDVEIAKALKACGVVSIRWDKETGEFALYDQSTVEPRGTLRGFDFFRLARTGEEIKLDTIIEEG